MAILSYLTQNPLQLLVAILVGVPVYHVLAWLFDEHSLRSTPGPWQAALSDGWLGYWAAKGQRSERVHEMHQKYGTYQYLLEKSREVHTPCRQVSAHSTEPRLNRRS